MRWIKIPTTNSKKEYDLNIFWMNCEPDHESVLTVPLICVICLALCRKSTGGSVLYPSVRAYDGICHTVTWLHEQLLSWLESVYVYICVCPVRDCLLDSQSWPLRGPRHRVRCHFLLTQTRSWGDSTVGAKQPPSGVCLPTKPSTIVSRSDI